MENAKFTGKTVFVRTQKTHWYGTTSREKADSFPLKTVKGVSSHKLLFKKITYLGPDV